MSADKLTTFERRRYRLTHNVREAKENFQYLHERPFIAFLSSPVASDVITTTTMGNAQNKLR